jgi:hypothetical protein
VSGAPPPERVAAAPSLRTMAAPPRGPPAIWAAMVRQSQWKSWALVVGYAFCALQGLVMLKLAHKEPDIVLIAPDGRSTYLNRSLAGDALVQFLDEQRQLPSDVTVVHFTRNFLNHFFATDSVGYEASFREALSMLSTNFRERVVSEAATTKLLESIRASHTHASVSLESLDFVERTREALHLRAVLLRRTESLAEGTLLSVDRLDVDVYESIVPRSAAHPDGLLIGQFTSRSERMSTSPAAREASPHAP